MDILIKPQDQQLRKSKVMHKVHALCFEASWASCLEGCLQSRFTICGLAHFHHPDMYNFSVSFNTSFSFLQCLNNRQSLESRCKRSPCLYRSSRPLCALKIV